MHVYIYIYIYIFIGIYMKYTDAWFMQQSVRPIKGSTHVRLYCWRY